MRYTQQKHSDGFWKTVILLAALALLWLGNASSFAAYETELDLGTINQLTIGSTTLLIKHPDEKTIAAYKAGDNQPLFQCERSDFQMAAGIVQYRMKSKGSEAALLELHNAGEIDETNFIILIDQKGTGLQKMDFGSRSITFGGEGSISKIRNKFRFERPAYPYQSGTWMEWSFEKGLRTGKTDYKPKGPGRMSVLFKDTDHEPLDNAEFYNAVRTLPAEDRDRMLVSMSSIRNICFCDGYPDLSRYGIRKLSTVLAISNCGVVADGHTRSCFGNDALAVWDRKTGHFYFAINSLSEGDRHSRADEDLHFFPPVEKWNRKVGEQLDVWQSDTFWATSTWSD